MEIMDSNTHVEKSAEALNELLITNIDIIDTQHKKITELLQKLLELKIHKVDFGAASVILNELDEHMNLHFETEENLMKYAGVNDIEKHIRQHDFFRVEFREFRDKAETKSDFLNNINYELAVSFLRNWLFAHTNKFDLLYIDSVQQHIVAIENAQKDKGNQ
jgi:hemerythrin-like metal-binding protein